MNAIKPNFTQIESSISYEDLREIFINQLIKNHKNVLCGMWTCSCNRSLSTGRNLWKYEMDRHFSFSHVSRARQLQILNLLSFRENE